MHPGACRRIGVVADQGHALGLVRHSFQDERRRDVGTVAGVLGGDHPALLEGRAGKFDGHGLVSPVHNVIPALNAVKTDKIATAASQGVLKQHIPVGQIEEKNDPENDG